MERVGSKKNYIFPYLLTKMQQTLFSHNFSVFLSIFCHFIANEAIIFTIALQIQHIHPLAACPPSRSNTPSALLAFLRRGRETARQRRVVDDYPPRPSSAAPHQSIHSQKTPRQNHKKEAKEKLLHFCKSFSYMDSGNVLLSRAVSSQVPSALKVLTSVFGMGTGGTPSPSSPETVNLFFSSHLDNCTALTRSELLCLFPISLFSGLCVEIKPSTY